MKRILSLTVILCLLSFPYFGRAEAASSPFLSDSGISFLSARAGHDTARRHLSPEEQRLYDYLKQQLLEIVASGGSVAIVIPETVMDYEVFSLTAEEVAELFDAEHDSSGPVFAAMRARVWDLVHIAITALECDEPGLFFWERGSVSLNDITIPMQSSVYGALVKPGEVTIHFPVLSEYGSGTDLSWEALARGEAQLSSVQTIVSRYASASDYEKLSGYMNDLIALAAYAADERNEGNDRNIARVFDGDPDTGVVCVGFARAFDYLCSQTVFESPEIKCMFIAGMVNEGPSYHAWNVVTMEDGKNYLVDTTFADGSEERSYRYFLRGQAGGSLPEGYIIPQSDSSFANYAYGNGVMTDMDCVRLFGAENLTLSATDYPLAQLDREWQEEEWKLHHPHLIDGTPGIDPNEGPENLFDGSVETKWRVSMNGSAFVEWQEPDLRHCGDS